MNEIIHRRNELLAEKVIKALESRNASASYAATREQALAQALELIPKGASIAMGGCVSAQEIGLVEALQSPDYNFIDRSKLSRREAALAAFEADVFLASANALTEDGVMVEIDGYGNRVSALVMGPEKLIFIVGMNKLCADIDSAIKRARTIAAPINASRFDINTPCKKTGSCANCKSHDTICAQILITRYYKHDGRVHIILVNDELGF